MTKKINIFVKGKMAVGKTTFIMTVRDILKKNKKFKELFNDYEFDIYEFAEDEGREFQSSANKKWTIVNNVFKEEEFLSVSYKKSFFGNIFNVLKAFFKRIF